MGSLFMSVVVPGIAANLYNSYFRVRMFRRITLTMLHRAFYVLRKSCGSKCLFKNLNCRCTIKREYRAQCLLIYSYEFSKAIHCHVPAKVEGIEIDDARRHLSLIANRVSDFDLATVDWMAVVELWLLHDQRLDSRGWNA